MSDESITIEAAIKAYDEDVSANKATKETRFFNLAFHFFTSRGLVYLSQIELRDLQALQRWLEKEQVLGHERKGPWKASTVNRVFHTLNHFFATMVEWEKISKDPSYSLKSLSEAEPEIVTVTADKYASAVDKTPEWFKPALEFIHETGCRPSSVSRLCWKHVDFGKREFTLIVKKGKERQLKFQMSDSIFAMLIKLRNQYPRLGSEDQVFRSSRGAPLSNGWISQKGTKIFKQVGRVPGGAMRALRHTLAVDLTTAGVPTEVVRQALIHSNIRTTQRYAKGIKPEVVGRAIALVRGDSMAPNGTKDEKQNSLCRAKGS